MFHIWQRHSVADVLGAFGHRQITTSDFQKGCDAPSPQFHLPISLRDPTAEHLDPVSSPPIMNRVSFRLFTLMLFLSRFPKLAGCRQLWQSPPAWFCPNPSGQLPLACERCGAISTTTVCIGWESQVPLWSVFFWFRDVLFVGKQRTSQKPNTTKRKSDASNKTRWSDECSSMFIVHAIGIHHIQVGSAIALGIGTHIHMARSDNFRKLTKCCCAPTLFSCRFTCRVTFDHRFIVNSANRLLIWVSRRIPWIRAKHNFTMALFSRPAFGRAGVLLALS